MVSQREVHPEDLGLGVTVEYEKVLLHTVILVIVVEGFR